MRKLLFWSDSPSAATGYGNVAYHFLQELQNYFEITVVCMSFDGNDVNWSLKRQGRPTFKENVYFLPSLDQSSGIDTLHRLIMNDQFDYLLLVNDFSRIDNFFLKRNFFDYKPLPFTIAYGAVDHVFNEYFLGPVNENPVEIQARRKTLETCNLVVPPSQYAFDFLIKYFPEHKEKITAPIFNPIDMSVFKPIDSQDRLDFRQTYFGGKVKEDDVLCININRHTPRKDIIRSMIIFYKVWQHSPICKMYIHTNPQEQGHHILDEISNAGVPESVLKKGIFLFPPPHNPIGGGVPEATLAQLTASADINFNCGMGEGTGLSNYQAAACKTLNLIPPHTGMKEIVNDGKGVELPTEWYWYWPGANPHVCTPVSVDKGAEILKSVVRNLYIDKRAYGEQIHKSYEWIRDKDVTEVRKKWRDLVQKII